MRDIATGERAWTLERPLLLAMLVFGVAIRLMRISQPFVDHWSWRQADVAMIAENFFRQGHRILYPQINWAGTSPGYVGTEFQLVPFIASLIYPFSGPRDWVGRAVSVAFFAASVPWYYALVKKAFDSTSALLALGLYVLAPLGIFASRSFMPDMASLGLSIAALLFFAQWLEAETPRSFGAAAAAAGLAVLLKLSSAVIGLPLVYMAWRRYGWGLLRRGPLWAYAAFTLAGPLAWYTHAFLVGTSHFPHDVWILGSGFALLPLDDYGGILTGALFSGVTPPVCALMLAGMWITFRDASPRYRLVFHWWLAGIVLFLFFASRRSLQHWYALPVAPVAAAFAGTALRSLARGVAKAGRPMVVVCLSTVLAGVGALSYLYASAWYAPRASPLWSAGMAVRRVTPANALVVFVDDGDPTGIYYSERKGWHFLNQGVWSGNPADSGQAIAALEALRRQGATYLVFTRRTFWWLDYYRDFGRYLDARYGRVRQTPDYIIFELRDRLWAEGGMHAGAERKSGAGR